MIKLLSTKPTALRFVNHFFLKIYIDNAYVQSFPTRRSSDLVEREIGDGRPQLGLRRPHRGLVLGVEAQARARSEEHTSELQSQFQLVCRLLLEKKTET